MKRSKTILALILLITLWGNLSSAQKQEFQINGIAKGIDSGSVKIVSLFSDPAQNSKWNGSINHGKFNIQGKILHPMRVFLVLNNSLYSDDFFIEPGLQDIFFDASDKNDFYSSMKITGSSNNDEFVNNYQKLLAPFYFSLDSCYTILDSLSKSSKEHQRLEGLTEICKNIELANEKVDSVRGAYIIEHPLSFVSIWTLYNSIGFLENLEFVKKSFNYLDVSLKNSLIGRRLAERLKVQNVFLNGNKFPSLSVMDSTGRKIFVNKSTKSKYTLVDFWFSHCGPCLVQFPKMLNLYNMYRSSGFDVIGISVDKMIEKAEWQNAILKHGLKWTQLWDADGKEANKFYIDAFPTTFLLDRRGRIIRKNVLLEELEILLAQELK